MNRRAFLILSADAGVELPARDLVVWGEGMMRRWHEAATPGTRNGNGGRGRRRHRTGRRRLAAILTAPWLGIGSARRIDRSRRSRTLEVKQVKVTSMEEGDRYEFEYTWKPEDERR